MLVLLDDASASTTSNLPGGDGDGDGEDDDAVGSPVIVMHGKIPCDVGSDLVAVVVVVGEAGVDVEVTGGTEEVSVIVLVG